MAVFTDIDDVVTPVTRQQLFDTAIEMMSNNISAEEVSRAFNIQVMTDESIFDALVREGIADNLYSSAVQIGRRFTPEGASTWNDIAKWVLEYEGHKVA